MRSYFPANRTQTAINVKYTGIASSSLSDPQIQAGRCDVCCNPITKAGATSLIPVLGKASGTSNI